ncbi:methyltransferase [Sinorhizobium psoraleae]|uniref:Methyltransferase n=1 Tax=Sinorhizobium psoraleae TaxID=520838 RepID=A0ABT4KQA3_9HYPH|nr:methyltransferase [Sinorhizobium psoraleae]MCZ4093466.1 methyltransferase [Sinorhizobium psoraleae]
MLKRLEPASLGDALHDICEHLEFAGVRDILACFDPLHPRHAHWAAALEAAPSQLQPLISLFQLGGSATDAELAALPQEALATLRAESLLKAAGDGWWLGGLMLMPAQGLWLLCHMAKPNPTLYFGDDSIGLALRLSAEPDQAVLDLCAGPGIQTLRAAQMGARVTAVEINPVAAALARLNAAANGLGERIDVRIGDLYKVLGDERFDRIIANPPLLPIPDDLPYPFVGHGGPDGLNITRRIIEGLPERLTARGNARLIGTTLSDGYLPLCLDELEVTAARLKLDIRMYVTAHHGLHDGAVYFEGLAATCASTGQVSVEAARVAYRTFLNRQDATHLCAYFLHIVTGDGRLDLIDVAQDPPHDLWFTV